MTHSGDGSLEDEREGAVALLARAEVAVAAAGSDPAARAALTEQALAARLRALTGEVGVVG